VGCVSYSDSLEIGVRPPASELHSRGDCEPFLVTGSQSSSYLPAAAASSELTLERRQVSQSVIGFETRLEPIDDGADFLPLFLATGVDQLAKSVGLDRK